jgi:hypothetical protein
MLFFWYNNKISRHFVTEKSLQNSMVSRQEKSEKEQSKLSQLEFELFSQKQEQEFDRQESEQEGTQEPDQWGKYEFFSAKMVRDLMQEEEISIEERNKGRKPKKLTESEKNGSESHDKYYDLYPFLRAFYAENKSVIDKIYGSNGAYEAMKKDFRAQLKQIKDLMYLKRIEDTLSKTVETRIGDLTEQVRDEMKKTYGWSFSSISDIPDGDIEDYFSEKFREKVVDLIGHETDLDGNAIKELRNASGIEDFEGLHIKIDEDYVKSYRELVQHELRQQLKSIAEATETDNEEEKIRSIYEKTNFLIDFVVSHIDAYGAKEFTKASLLRQVKTEEGAELISSLYQQILESLEADDTSESERLIQEMSTQMQVMSLVDRRGHVQEVFGKYAPEVELTNDEIDTLFTSRVIDENTGEVTYFTNAAGVTYHELIGRGLENIEMARYQIALNKMLPADMQNQDAMSRHMNRISAEMSELKKHIKRFRDEAFNTNRLIDDKGSWLSVNKCYELKQAMKSLTLIRGAQQGDEDSYDGMMKPILIRLQTAENNGDIQDLIDFAETEIIAYLGEQGITKKQIERFQKLDPLFNLYRFFNKWKEQQGPSMAEIIEDQKTEADISTSVEMERDDGLDRDPIITKPGTLEKIRVHLEQMEKIVERNFSEEHDKDAFDDSRRDLQRIAKKETFIVDVPVYDEQGRPLYDGDEMRVERKEKQKDLPEFAKEQLKVLLTERENLERYSHLEDLKKEKFFEDKNFNINLENPNSVRTALEALYGGFNKVGAGHTQLQRLSKVMTLDHPLTAIRMHAADQSPFAPSGHYEIHKNPGEDDPASYLSRGTYILRRAQKFIKEGNYVELEKLFDDGQIANRLYMDAKFFPLKILKSQKATQETIFTEKREGTKIAMVVDKKRITNPSDRNYFKREYNRLEGGTGTFKRERDLAELNEVKGCLADDIAFSMAFGADEDRRINALDNHQSTLVFNEDGTLNLEKSEAAFDELQAHVMGSVGECRGLGVPGGTKLSEEKLREIAKDYPVMAGRMAQFNSMMVGGTVGGAEMAARYGWDTAKFGVQLPMDVMGDFWKKLDWYSPQHIWMAVDQMVEHISGLTDFRVKIGSYDLLQNVFAGTLVGNEFAKLYQGEEDRRVGEFKDAFGDFGHGQVIDKLYTASDQFELKAALLEGMENRGVITLEDLMDRRFFKQLNRYTNGVTIDLNHTEEEMQADEEVKFKMINQLRAAMDDIWGDGTWQSWRSAAAGKYESKRKESWDNFSGNSSREKARHYENYWEMLKSPKGIKELKKMHPGELVGNIEQDLEQGDNDCGTNFAIMQAMISMDIVKLDHVRRLQTAHTNDLPIHALLEPKQAELSGLSDHVKKALKDGKKLDYKNPIVLFFQGQKTLPLTGFRSLEKWKFPMDEKTKREKEAAGELEKIEVTVHQLQAAREAQPEFHRKMDNSCIGIFTPCYEWSQIENALSPDTQGNIQARPHDIAAAYRGIHYEFGAYIEALADTSKMKDAKTFNRTVWMAYKAICKTQAYASFMTRQQGRENDYNTNAFDGSPNFESKHRETRASSGTTNFEKLIIEGAPDVRMMQSSEHLDGISSLSNDLRRDFKHMAGHQFVKSLGVDTETGMANRDGFNTYNKDSYDPSGQWKKVMGSFMTHVKKQASQHSWGADVISTLDDSAMGNVSLENEARQKKLNAWMVNEAEM